MFDDSDGQQLGQPGPQQSEPRRVDSDPAGHVYFGSGSASSAGPKTNSSADPAQQVYSGPGSASSGSATLHVIATPTSTVADPALPGDGPDANTDNAGSAVEADLSLKGMAAKRP
eukprot:13571626-Alexandrium_andersonii.AAC.2